MVDDAVEYTYNWATATYELETAMRNLDGTLIKSLSSSKAWTMVSRFISGSPIWQLQNKIRAFTDAFVAYDNAMKMSATRTKELSDATDAYAKIAKKLPRGLTPDMIGKAADYVKGGGTFEFKEGKIGKPQQAAMDIVQSERFRLLKEIFGQDEALDIAKASLEEQQKMVEKFKEEIMFMKEFNVAPLQKKVLMQGLRFRRFLKTIFMGFLVPFVGGALKFFAIGLAVLPVLLGTLRLIFKAIGFIGGYFFDIYKTIVAQFGGESLFKNIKDIFGNTFSNYLNLLSAVMSGKLEEIGLALVTLFGQFALDFLALAYNGFKIVFVGFMAIVAGIVDPIVKLISAIVNFIGGGIKSLAGGFVSGMGMPILGGALSRASGGVAGGMTLVGERGPEFVNLPYGSRVHSNANSRRMGGNTINVHVNGRVGASDSEIRDIAQKVAREINIQMNRTGTVRSGF